MFYISKVFISRVFHYLGKCVHEKKKINKIFKWKNVKRKKYRHDINWEE